MKDFVQCFPRDSFLRVAITVSVIILHCRRVVEGYAALNLGLRACRDQ